MFSKIIAELPESIDELHVFGDSITKEPEFLEVNTNSPRFVDSLEALPVFVVTGFQPKKIRTLYENFIYPTFEARLPEIIESIEYVSTQLVQVMKNNNRGFLLICTKMNNLINSLIVIAKNAIKLYDVIQDQC